MMRVCSVQDCGRKHFGKGYCEKHYLRWIAHGDPLVPRAIRPCSVEGCGNPYKAKGFCRDHYYRNLHHGDPLGGRTERGSVARYYNDVVLSYEGDECLIWPYTRSSRGYGLWRVEDGRTSIVSRRLCEDTSGPPPAPEYDAAHSCGRGHLGCVTKRHLSWKTKRDNAEDRKLHGTHHVGSLVSCSRLTEREVHAIRALRGRMTTRVVAEKFAISQTHVTQIQRRVRWGWLQDKAGA